MPLKRATSKKMCQTLVGSDLNKMLLFTFFLLFNCLLIVKSPNTLAEANEIKTDTANEQDFEELGLHYGKYLKEVVAALDKDQKFTETIKNMDAEDIKSGKVAEQLKHVHEDVRKKLNELKYLEIKRLRDLATRKNEMEQYGETYHGTDKRKWRTIGSQLKNLPGHISSDSGHFDVNDLHKLMVSATEDLEKLDKDRREDYKTYEMEKEWQFEERLKGMNETEKQEAMKLRQQLKEKHDDHPKIHEPGTRQQFEEVWSKKDGLPTAEFDPKTFFALHDTNSDNHWDPQEVRQLLRIEIEKLYDPNNPEDDPNEMEEEFERMREHIYQEIDADRDGLIRKEEFLEYSKKPNFSKDNGWEDVSKKEAYSKQDYEDFRRHREEKLRAMHGNYDPAYYANQPSNLHLPNWAYGMPANANPAQYYGYAVDPNHPQAHQILAQQQQQLAYHQQAAFQQHQAAAYQHPAAIPQQPYQQPNQQQYYQAPQLQNNQYQQKPPVQQQQTGQINYQQQAPQQPVAQPAQGSFQQAPQVAPAAPAQATYQASPPQQQQQQPPVPQQQQPPVPQQQQPPQQPPQANQPQANQQYYQAPPAQQANQYQQQKPSS